MTAPKALRSGYAGKQQRDRSQHHRTPPIVLEPIQSDWDGIELDPCASPRKAHHFARENYTRRGLDLPWRDRTYANPPYSGLGDWLAKAAEEAANGYRIRLLGPWRSHRLTFCAALFAADIVLLKAFPFHGQKETSPFPCFVASWGCPAPYFGALELGRCTIRPPRPTQKLVAEPSGRILRVPIREGDASGPARAHRFGAPA